MPLFTDRKRNATIARVKTWFSFEDVVKWYFLDQAGEPTNQTVLAELINKQRQHIGMAIKGKRPFTLKDLDAFVESKKWNPTKLAVVDALYEITSKMQLGTITKEQLEDRIEAAGKRGRKPVPERQIGPHEFMKELPAKRQIQAKPRTRTRNQ